MFMKVLHKLQNRIEQKPELNVVEYRLYKNPPRVKFF
jgi:hypothetical protein